MFYDGDGAMTAASQRSKLKASSQSTRHKDLHLTAIRRSGWLKKQGGLVKSWQSRWFVLSNDCLYYYSTSEDFYTGKSPSGRLTLASAQLCQPVNASQDADKYTFNVLAGNDSSDAFVLSSSSEDDRNNWIKDIRMVIYYDRGGAIFGQPLEQTMRYEHNKGEERVPRVVKECISFITDHGLDIEGVFRLPGRSTLIRRLHNDFDSAFPSPILTPGDVDVHSAASLLKLYLRELPEPLVCFADYENVVKICNRDWYVDGREAALSRLAAMIGRLPLDRYELTREVSRFLNEVAGHSHSNKMTAMNLATIFANSFLRPESDDDPALLMGTATARTHCVHLLIEEWRDVFSLCHPSTDSDDDFLNNDAAPNTASATTYAPTTADACCSLARSRSASPGMNRDVKCNAGIWANSPQREQDTKNSPVHCTENNQENHSENHSENLSENLIENHFNNLTINHSENLTENHTENLTANHTENSDIPRRPLSERELMNRYEDDTGKSILSLTRRKTVTPLSAPASNARQLLRLRIPPKDSKSREASVEVRRDTTPTTSIADSCGDHSSLHSGDHSSLHSGDHSSLHSKNHSSEDDDSDDECRRLVGLDAESLNRDQLLQHAHHLASELVAQRRNVKELRAQLLRQSKRDARLLEKTNRKLCDERTSSESAIRRLASLQSRLNDYENKATPITTPSSSHSTHL